MTIPANILSETLSILSRSHLAAIRTRLDDFDDMLCTAILIEAARVIDYENVLMGSSEDESHHLPYPAFDVMCRGWNPLLHYVLPRLPKIGGIPIQESTSTTRAHARSILHAFGQYAVLQKAADMSFHGFLAGSETENGISLKLTAGEDSDHFLDQLEAEALEKALNGTDESPTVGRLASDEVNELAASLVFPFETGRGTMVGYDADPRLDAHFIELVGPKTVEWRAEAGIHPDIDGDQLNGADIAAVVMMLASFYLKHIWIVGVGNKRLSGINYYMSLTIWKKPDELVDSISSFTRIDAKRIEAALRAIVVTREDAAYFDAEPTPLMPMLLEITEGFWLAPVSSIFRNPFNAGRKVPAPPEPPQRGPGGNGRVRLDGRFRGHVAEAKRMAVDGPFASERVPEDLEARRDQERKAIGRVTVPREMTRPHSGLSEVLNREEKRLAKFEASGWDWHRPKHDHKLAQRELRLADALLKALAKRHHQGLLDESDTGFELHVTVGDTSLRLAIEYRVDGRRSSTRPDDRQLRELPASTPLKIEMRHVWHKDVLASWGDGPELKLERQISDIAAGIIVAAEARFRRSLAETLEEEKRRRQREEEAPLRELDRLRKQRLVDLKTSGELLRQAEEIRELVARVERRMLGEGSLDCKPEQVKRWKAWALAQADAFDPVLSGQVLKHFHIPELDDS